MKNIILIGMPGAGKSTVGVLLAKAVRYDFTDADLIIQRRENATLQEIIDSRGLDGFLLAEENALISIDVTHTVIATGGSAVFSEKGMEHLKQNGVCVYLKVSLGELVRRLTNITTRGIACKKGETVEEILKERDAYYNRYADIVIDCDGQRIEQTVAKVVKELNM